MDSQPVSVYHRGAEDGAWMGVLFSAMFLLMIAGTKSAIAGLLAMIIFLAVPVIVFFRMRRTWRQERGFSTFSGLWMQGIMTFICGSLIMGVAIYVYMRFVNPGFIAEQAAEAEDIYRQIGADDFADTLRTMIDHHLLPKPITMAFTMIWTGSFTGSILSMILAMLVRLTNPDN